MDSGFFMPDHRRLQREIGDRIFRDVILKLLKPSRSQHDFYLRRHRHNPGKFFNLAGGVSPNRPLKAKSSGIQRS